MPDPVPMEPDRLARRVQIKLHRLLARLIADGVQLDRPITVEAVDPVFLVRVVVVLRPLADGEDPFAVPPMPPTKYPPRA